jgi:hypothetical protein
VVLTGIGVSLGMVNDMKLTWTGLLDEIRAMIQTRESDILSGNEWIGSPEEKAQKPDQAVKAKFPHLDYRQYVSVIMRSITSPDHHHRLAVAIQILAYQLQLQIMTFCWIKRSGDLNRTRLMFEFAFLLNITGNMFIIFTESGLIRTVLC